MALQGTAALAEEQRSVAITQQEASQLQVTPNPVLN